MGYMVISTDLEDVTFELDLEAEIGADAVQARLDNEAENEERDTLYSPNRFCEVTLYPHVWDEFQTLMQEWEQNFFDVTQ